VLIAQAYKSLENGSLADCPNQMVGHECKTQRLDFSAHYYFVFGRLNCFFISEFDPAPKSGLGECMAAILAKSGIGCAVFAAVGAGLAACGRFQGARLAFG
jgi:hypothetical protein